MFLPTFAFDLGPNSGPVQSGYKVFVGGPVAATGIILEPGGDQTNVYLGIYLLITWLANFAIVLPILAFIPQRILRLLVAVFAVLAWSVLVSYLLIADNLIREIGIGYYLWAASITLIFLYFSANKHAPAINDGIKRAG